MRCRSEEGIGLLYSSTSATESVSPDFVQRNRGLICLDAYTTPSICAHSGLCHPGLRRSVATGANVQIVAPQRAARRRTCVMSRGSGSLVISSDLLASVPYEVGSGGIVADDPALGVVVVGLFGHCADGPDPVGFPAADPASGGRCRHPGRAQHRSGRRDCGCRSLTAHELLAVFGLGNGRLEPSWGDQLHPINPRIAARAPVSARCPFARARRRRR